MRGRLRIKIDLDPRQVYADLGPLSIREVEWLSRKSKAERRRYLTSIYGTTTSGYANTQYRRIFESIQEKEVVTNGRVVSLSNRV